MRRAYALSEEEFCRAEAELELALSLGLIGQAGFDALEQRRGLAAEKHAPGRDVAGRRIDALAGLAHEAVRTFLQRQGGGILGPGGSHGCQGRHHFIDHVLHQRLAAAELVLQRTQRDLGAARDVLQRGLLEAHLLQQPHRGVEDLALRCLAALRLAAPPVRGADGCAGGGARAFVFLHVSLIGLPQTRMHKKHVHRANVLPGPDLRKSWLIGNRSSGRCRL